MSEPLIPVIDLRELEGPRRAEVVDALGRGLERIGFVAVVGHGIAPETLTRAYGLAERLFALPVAAKQRYETPRNGRQRGYTSFGIEHARDTTAPDLKEFWHHGRVLPADHPLRVRGEVPENQIPAEIPELAPFFDDYFRAVEGFANRLLVGVAEYLGQPAGYFEDMVRDGNSVLRIIHYPDVGPVVPGAVRAAAHEDINLLTVLPISTRPGLQILTRDGDWVDAVTPPDVMLCDTGDMMARLTGGRLPATTHRVVNPDSRDGGRMSMPFFLHPHPDHVLTPLFESDEAPILAREFLHARLREIGVA